jgi:NAD(P)-dependent dehydrogenase (short-subunit alcohol dehydrogenase family)
MGMMMDLKIQGKKALVTGGGRGLGRSIASCLVQEGVHVCIVSRTTEDLDSFIDEHGDGHSALCYDLMADGAPTKMVSEMRGVFGQPDIIIHNVGGAMDINDPFCDIEGWRRVYRFNLEISVEINLMLVPYLQEKKWGRIIHISSISALENQGTVPYCSMKAAVNAYVRSFGRYVSKDGICMSTVMPGAVFTEGGYWDYTSKNRPEHFERYRKERMAIQRFGEPDEIGKVVTFLCSDQASFIVGSSFLVDGGQGRVFQNNEIITG